jgi:ABC-type transporter Mla subunit MlaD
LPNKSWASLSSWPWWALATILILMGINQRWFAQNYLFTTKLRNAVGLSQGMAIKFKGFDIGKVTDFSFNSEEDMVDVTVEIFDTYYEQVRKQQPDRALHRDPGLSVGA